MFSKNRDRLLEGDIAAKFLSAILVQPKVKRLVSTDHFSVNGTLIEACASMKSVKPKDGPKDGQTGGPGAPPVGGGGRNAEADFHGEKRTNQTHASTTDPDARLYRKGWRDSHEHRLTGRWRIVEADLWDRGHPDLADPAMTAIGADGHGEIAFGALQASLDLGYSPSMVHFT